MAPTTVKSVSCFLCVLGRYYTLPDRAGAFAVHASVAITRTGVGVVQHLTSQAAAPIFQAAFHIPQNWVDMRETASTTHPLRKQNIVGVRGSVAAHRLANPVTPCGGHVGFFVAARGQIRMAADTITTSLGPREVV